MTLISRGAPLLSQSLGAEGPADRITLMTIGMSPTLVSVASPAAADVATTHALTAQIGETTSIFVHYLGIGVEEFGF